MWGEKINIPLGGNQENLSSLKVSKGKVTFGRVLKVLREKEDDWLI